MKTRSALTTRSTLLAAAIASLLQPSPSFAQKTGATLDEVVVTARRREEMVQDVPISISALSAEALAREGVQSIVDISAKTPSLTITATGASRSVVAFAIRGQRAQESQLLSDPPVGTYFAEVVQPRPFGFGNSLYDLQSVQVLKGVQGTLFGRNMTGGAVLVEPNAPAQELQGELRGTVGNYNLREVYGMFNAPVTDSVAFRLAGKTSRRDGFIKDVSNDRKYDDVDYNAARASLLFSPTDEFENTLIVDYYESDESGAAPVLSALRPGSTAALAGLTSAFAQQQARSEFRVDPGAGEGGPFDAFGKLPYEHQKNVGVTNKTTYEINADMTLKNVMGYRKLQRETMLDYDSTPVPTITAFQFADIEAYSEELQLQGVALDDALDYVAGVYYFLEKGVDASRSSQFPQFRPTVPAVLQVSQNGADGRSETYAAFVAGTYAFTDELSLSAGVRYNYDSRRAIVGPQAPNAGACLFDLDNNASNGIQSVPIANCHFSDSQSWNAVTWDTTLQWQPTAETMLYGAVRKGFRAGGYTTRAANFIQLEPFDPEYVLEYELGVKNTADLGDFASLVTNAAVFYQDYEDVQKQRPFVTPQGAVVTIVDNTASQVNSGGELEATLDFHNGLTTSLFYAYVDIEIKEGGQGEYPMHGTPHNQVGASINYMTDLAAIGALNVNLNAVYRSKTPLDDFDRAGIETGYSVTNFRASLDGIAGTGFGAALFVNNLTDEEYRTGGIGLVREVGFFGDIYGMPRMYGAEVSYQF